MNITDRLERLVPSRVRELVPYRVEESEGLLKLDAMENPYDFPPQLIDAWMSRLAGTGLNRYPDPAARTLRKELLQLWGLGSDFGVVLGNGSDELIHMLCLCFARGEQSSVLCPAPSFAVYRIAAEAVGMRFETVPLREADFSLDLDAMLAACEKHQPSLVFLASPNNPTANAFSVSDLVQICEQTPGLVVLDEAYYRFAGRSEIELLRSHENLVVMQTFSKIGLAGLRVGMLYGNQAWVQLLERVRMPYNLGTLAQEGALFALEHADVFEEQISRIIAERGRLSIGLRQLRDLKVWPSVTNFLLLRTPPGQGTAIFDSLKARRILVKSLSGAHPFLQDTLRVTVGTRDENDLLLAALEAAISPSRL
jgi:histidinol-phosphate aminotransferase